MKNKLTLFLMLLLIAVISTKCGSDAEFSEKELIENKKSSQIITTIDKTTVDSLNINESHKVWTTKFYSLINNQSLWIKNGKLSDSLMFFFNYLNSDIALNLPIGHLNTIPFLEPDDIINKEITSILRCAEFLSLKDTTIINYSNNTLNKLQLVSPSQFLAFIKAKQTKDSWVEHLVKYKEKNQRLIQLHFALNQFTAKYGIEDNKNNNIYLKTPEDSLALVFVSKQLFLRNFISDTLMDTVLLKENLRNFQLLNGLNTDAKLGKNTMAALMETNYSRFLKGVITLDKMREIPDSLTQGRSIVINIPSYLLHLYDNNKTLNTSKVIIGTQRNQTPEFTSRIKYIVVSPYWNVPYSIASKEILPHLKEDVTYLSRNNYSLLDKDKNILSPDSIDWKNFSTRNFPFFIRQEPGPKNSLGMVKLLFPNKNSIYIHDTPSKHLFSKEVRTFSHGCIRTESPFKLVKDILAAENHKYIDSVEIYKESSKETYLILSEKFPVSIIYQTSGINDSTHQVQFYQDIYTKEKELYELFPAPRVGI